MRRWQPELHAHTEGISVPPQPGLAAAACLSLRLGREKRKLAYAEGRLQRLVDGKRKQAGRPADDGVNVFGRHHQRTAPLSISITVGTPSATTCVPSFAG